MASLSVVVQTASLDRKGRQHWLLKTTFRGREFGIRKRFSELAKFSHHLQSTTLRGIVLTHPFPEKNYPWSSSKRDEDVLKKRHMQLQLWFDMIISLHVVNSLLREFLCVDDFLLQSMRQDAEVSGLIALSKNQQLLEGAKSNMLSLSPRITQGVSSPSVSPRGSGIESQNNRPPLHPATSRSTSSSSSARHVSTTSTTPPASLASSPSSGSSFTSSFLFGRMRSGSRAGSIAEEIAGSGAADGVAQGPGSSSKARTSSTLSRALAAALSSSSSSCSSAQAPVSSSPRSSGALEAALNGGGGGVGGGGGGGTHGLGSLRQQHQVLSSGSFTQSSSLAHSLTSGASMSASSFSRGPSPSSSIDRDRDRGGVFYGFGGQNRSQSNSFSRSMDRNAAQSGSLSGSLQTERDILLMGPAALQAAMLQESFGLLCSRQWTFRGEDTIEVLEQLLCYEQALPQSVFGGGMVEHGAGAGTGAGRGLDAGARSEQGQVHVCPTNHNDDEDDEEEGAAFVEVEGVEPEPEVEAEVEAETDAVHSVSSKASTAMSSSEATCSPSNRERVAEGGLSDRGSGTDTGTGTGTGTGTDAINRVLLDISDAAAAAPRLAKIASEFASHACLDEQRAPLAKCLGKEGRKTCVWETWGEVAVLWPEMSRLSRASSNATAATTTTTTSSGASSKASSLAPSRAPSPVPPAPAPTPPTQSPSQSQSPPPPGQQEREKTLTLRKISPQYMNIPKRQSGDLHFFPR